MEQESSQPQEIKGEHVTLTIHRKPRCRAELHVNASKELVQKAKKQAIKEVSKEVTIPGFRKGKAPDDLILKHYPKEIDRRWQEVIADLSFRDAEKAAHVPLLSHDTKISFSMKNHSLDEASLTLSFETEPEIPVVDPKELTIKEVQRPLVNEEKVQETIRQVLFFFAEWNSVSDRAIEEGDFILVDADVIENDPPSALFSDTRFEVTDKSMAKWMKDLVLGKRIGDAVEGVSVADDTLSEEEKAEFTPKKVRIKIKSVETAKLPELTEEFIKKLGVQNREELENRVRHLLNKQADEHVQEKLREQASEFLLTKYPFDLPATLIERETQFRMKQLGQDTQFQSFWQRIGEEERKNMIKSIFDQAEKAVRMFYLCRKILNDANLNITNNDLPQAATSPLEILLDPQQMMHYHQQPDLRQAEALSRIVLEKAEDYVIAHAQRTQEKSS